MPVVYCAVERFDPSCGQRWREFIDWSGLTQLSAVVSLDCALCPNFIKDLTDEDWQRNVQESFKLNLFHDLDYLVHRVGEWQQVNILALLQNPTEEEIQSFSDRRFEFRGFDLVELQTGISAGANNCGGFEKVFARSELSECGLLTDYTHALRIEKGYERSTPMSRTPIATCGLSRR